MRKKIKRDDIKGEGIRGIGVGESAERGRKSWIGIVFLSLKWFPWKEGVSQAAPPSSLSYTYVAMFQSHSSSFTTPSSRKLLRTAALPELNGI